MLCSPQVTETPGSRINRSNAIKKSNSRTFIKSMVRSYGTRPNSEQLETQFCAKSCVFKTFSCALYSFIKYKLFYQVQTLLAQQILLLKTSFPEINKRLTWTIMNVYFIYHDYILTKYS